MTPDIRLSVALITRNRPDALERCLESLRAQNLQPYEVVVSDDSDDEGFTSATREMATKFECRYIAGPRGGLYANRNFSALQCTGTHIRTMDDDHTFPVGHFEQCVAAVRSDPCAVWTTGETCIVEGKSRGGLETATQLHPSGVGGPVENPDDNWAIADGSTIYPRVVFERGLRMVEDFGHGSSYLEFGAFLYRHGFRSRCVPGAMVNHHILEATLAPVELKSRLFASLCFNLYFRPDRKLAAKYSASYVLLKRPVLLIDLPWVLERARTRWKDICKPGES